MEKGFYHPSRGYWQTMDVPSQQILEAFPKGTIEVPLKPGQNHEWDSDLGAWRELEYAVPSPPRTISDRQFFQQLANMGLISEAEAENAVASGALPAAMLPLIEAIPIEQQFAARMLLKGATQFDREHPMSSTIGEIYGMTQEQIDQLWREASEL